LVADPIATGREIIVSSVLILVRASLIVFTGGLVVVRPRLIQITRRLVVFQPRLIPVTLALVAISCRVITDLTDPTRQDVGATRRTARTRADFAAGRTFHNPRHHRSLPRASELGAES
jgi:hypothetical protein